MESPEPASAEDASRLLALREQAAHWLTARGIAQWLPGEVGVAETRAQIGDGEWFVLRRHGMAVAGLRLLEHDEPVWGPQPANAVYLHGLVVDRDLAGGGLGTDLLRWAECRTIAAGRRFLRLDCVESNPTLRAYYRRAGFREVGPPVVGDFADRGWHPVVLLEKRLDPPPGRPTQYEELNRLLEELTQRAQDILGDNFAGAYVQGSFAVGDADLHSDCDFLIPVHRPLTYRQESALRALHDEIPARDGHWSQELEGSYPVADDLRSLAGLGARWLYIDRGRREMQWSTHCNTEVARWSLRERGIRLAGPDPTSLVDPVPPEALRRRMREQIPGTLDDVLGWASLDVAWTQRYVVATLCRMLYTLEHGQVTSKKAALAWASSALDRRWHALIRQVTDDRERGWDPDDPPRPGSLPATLAFAAHATQLAGVTAARRR